MKKRPNKNQKITKGMPSAVVLSIVIHVALFLLAGMLVVFTVVKKEEQKFEPPKAVERPKMKLKKPKVKVKKTSKPKPTTRIVTKVNRASLPDIQLPEMSGLTDGLGGGLGGFDMMPDFEKVTEFGGAQSIGNDFVGTFYDMKRDRSGRNLPTPGRGTFVDILYNFMKKEFKTSELSRYYRSPKKLYTTTFAMPPDLSLMAPQAFGEYDTIGYFWLAHYKGELVYPEDITFRFWGAGDDVLAVRVDGDYVLVTVGWPHDGAPMIKNLWDSTSSDSGKFPLGNQMAVVGDWITLKAGEPLNMEVVVSEIPGGNFQAVLCVEVQGEEYPTNPYRRGPTLPIFKTERPSLDLVETIHSRLSVGDASVTNGPVFRDFFDKPITVKKETEPGGPIAEVESPAIGEDRVRTWNSDSGKPFQAEFVTLVAGNRVVLKNAKGKQIKVPLKELSDDDQNYIALERPPEFKIDFSKRSRQITPPEQPPNTWYRSIQIFAYTFGVKLKQTSTGNYDHDLEIEYYAIGDEVDGDNFVLLERNTSILKPMDEKNRFYEFYGDEVRIQSQAILPTASMRGTKYGGYLVTITDSRGKIVQYATSNEFLFRNLENLKKIQVGRHFDRACNYVGPPRPTRADRPTWM